MIGNTLSDDEELKIERICVLLKFLSKKEAIYFIRTGPYRFDREAGSFHDHITGLVIAPNFNLINFFYTQLYNASILKLKEELSRSKIKGLRRLLVRFNNLDFLPLAI